MKPEEQVLARTEVSWKAILIPLLLAVLLFAAHALPLWFRWLFLFGMVVLSLGYAVQQVVITHSTLRKTYPLRLMFRDGPEIVAASVKRMTCYHATSRVHTVVAEAVQEGRKYVLDLEVASYDIRCHVFDFAVRHDIPLICRSDDDQQLTEQIRSGKCRLDPAKGHWNISGTN